MTDDAYAKRKRGYLYSNHPVCDSNSDGVIQGDDEDECVMKIKFAEYEKRNEEKK
ncbi:MAG: hypothetical protein JZU49_04110 [Sulfuricurvum sp.]|nr:hypothetical protein [Sulfuricurvum sp.]